MDPPALRNDMRNCLIRNCVQLRTAASNKFLFFLGSAKDVKLWCRLPTTSGSAGGGTKSIGRRLVPGVDYDESMSIYAKQGFAYDADGEEVRGGSVTLPAVLNLI